jgi:hypothetical protein
VKNVAKKLGKKIVKSTIKLRIKKAVNKGVNISQEIGGERCINERIHKGVSKLGEGRRGTFQEGYEEGDGACQSQG